jgi:HK97 gp10 family phage protein
MPQATVEIIGFEALTKQIHELSEGISKEIENALEKGAVVVRNAAIEKLSPYIVKTMGGRKAIHVESRQKSHEPNEVVVTVDPDYILYMPRGQTELRWVEFGKPGYVPYPFLRQSFDENLNKVLDTISEDLKKTIERVLGK